MIKDMNTKITIIGAGAIGRAIEHILIGNGVQPVLWDKDSTKVVNQGELSDAVKESDILFFCVPSWVLRSACEMLVPYLPPETILVGISKGLEQGTGLRTDEVLASVFPKNPIVLLSGPMLASEIRKGAKAYAVVAAENNAVAEQVAKFFEGTLLRITILPDLATVALAGVLKNIYAIILGIASGLQCGHNVRGFLATQSLEEMRTIARVLNMNQDVLLSTAGLGDLVATGFSEASSNHRLGLGIVEEGAVTLQSEGLVSLPSLASLLGEELALQLPLFFALKETLANPEQRAAVFKKMFEQKS